MKLVKCPTNFLIIALVQNSLVILYSPYCSHVTNHSLYMLSSRILCCFRSFTKSRILLSALAGTMFFGNVMFLMSVEDYARNTDGFCTFLGLAVHYLFLSSFLWMLTHALNVYIAVAKPIVYRTIKWVFVKAALFAWGK